MSDHWTDRIVGDRMAVDQEFNDRVEASEFTRQQWGLIMTAVEFRIDRAGEEPRLAADTTDLPSVVPELDSMEHPPGAMGAGQQDDAGGGPFGGLVGGLKDALGMGGDDEVGFDEEQLAAAENLTQEYADRLQAHLEQRGKWADVCETERASDQ